MVGIKIPIKKSMWISFLNLIVLSTLIMANFQCKKLDPLVTGDIGSLLCRMSTIATALLKVIRHSDSLIAYQLIEMCIMKKVKSFRSTEMVGLCAECNFWECDRCDEKIYCDEDFTPYDVYRPDEFLMNLMMVHTVSLRVPN